LLFADLELQIINVVWQKDVIDSQGITFARQNVTWKDSPGLLVFNGIWRICVCQTISNISGTEKKFKNKFKIIWNQNINELSLYSKIKLYE
jgi:hypothetical protein